MCLICQRIELIKSGDNPYFVKELETGYVVIGDHQYFEGYTLFLAKEHVTAFPCSELSPTLTHFSPYLRRKLRRGAQYCTSFWRVCNEKKSWRKVGKYMTHIMTRVTGATQC